MSPGQALIQGHFHFVQPCRWDSIPPYYYVHGNSQALTMDALFLDHVVQALVLQGDSIAFLSLL